MRCDGENDFSKASGTLSKCHLESLVWTSLKVVCATVSTSHTDSPSQAFWGRCASVRTKERRKLAFKGLWWTLIYPEHNFRWLLQNFNFAHPLRGDGRFLLGWSCERSCACHSLVDSSYQQPIGLNYTSFGAWEAASTTTRCRQVDLGCAMPTIVKESRSLWGLLPANITCGRPGSFCRVRAYHVTLRLWQLPCIMCACMDSACYSWITWVESPVFQWCQSININWPGWSSCCDGPRGISWDRSLVKWLQRTG